MFANFKRQSLRSECSSFSDLSQFKRSAKWHRMYSEANRLRDTHNRLAALLSAISIGVNANYTRTWLFIRVFLKAQHAMAVIASLRRVFLVWCLCASVWCGHVSRSGASLNWALFLRAVTKETGTCFGLHFMACSFFVCVPSSSFCEISKFPMIMPDYSLSVLTSVKNSL